MPVVIAAYLLTDILVTGRAEGRELLNLGFLKKIWGFLQQQVGEEAWMAALALLGAADRSMYDVKRQRAA